ncbi:MAG TPA: DUF1684 domain-containing protein [Gemmatimonadales bacterium]
MSDSDSESRRRSAIERTVLAALLLSTPLAAQSTPADVAQERTAYVAWLRDAPNSPLAAVAQQPIGPGLRLGPADADIPLPGVREHRVSERGGSVRLQSVEGENVVARGRPLRLGSHTLTISGPPGKAVLTVFADSAARKPPEHYPYDPSLAFEGTLAPPEQGGPVRLLAVDGVETQATEAGTVTVPLGGARVKLRVRRIRSGAEESELEIFFRDGTNGEETYPAGRFVSLVPIGDGRYRLDFNRARSPFCAYSTAYPCPAPWGGNTIPAPVRAGERYSGGGLAVPPVSADAP